MSKMRKVMSTKVEWKYIYQLIDSIEDNKIKNYIANQIEWHVIRANRYRFYDNLFKIMAVIMPTIVAIADKCFSTTNTCAQVLVLGGATITSAAGSFLKLHEKRLLYRKTAEEIKEECTLYVNCVEEYNKADKNEKFLLKIHEIVKRTNNNWCELEQTKKESTEEHLPVAGKAENDS